VLDKICPGSPIALDGRKAAEQGRSFQPNVALASGTSTDSRPFDHQRHFNLSLGVASMEGLALSQYRAWVHLRFLASRKHLLPACLQWFVVPLGMLGIAYQACDDREHSAFLAIRD
jgi:hypothetical protein